jgi:hypothetical protein
MGIWHRLLDIADLGESDARVQTVFTVVPDVFNGEVDVHLRRLGALVISWHQATREPFDLAISAAHGGLHELHAPIMLVAHGAGRARLFREPAGGRRASATPTVYGLDAPRLIRDGRVLPTVLMLSHENEREVLARQCPEALPIATVAGDICFDRLVAGLGARPHHRRQLGLSARQSLVVVNSTWGESGLFGGVPDLVPALVDQLPPQRFRVALLLHPAIWGAHGRRQVNAWTRECQESGMLLVDPADDWRTYLTAADHLIGDHGSVTAYGAAIGLPVLCVAPSGDDRTAASSPQSLVLRTAERLNLTLPLHRQVLAARPADHREVAAAITSRPGRCARVLRRTIYRLVGIPEPGRIAAGVSHPPRTESAS